MEGMESNRGKKVNVHPRAGHEGPQNEVEVYLNSFLNQLDGGG